MDAAARFEMSPIPVREALRSLASEGLVVPLPQRGYRVTEATVQDLDDTYRLRLMLDPLAVRLAVDRMDEPLQTYLGERFDRLVDSFHHADWPTHRVHHRNFHFAIYDHCGSGWLLRFLMMLWENSDRYQRLSSLHRGTTDQRIAEHREILEACLDGDAEEAARRMGHHLNLTYRTVRDLLTAPGGPE